jgi:general L-amino acid transport system substrate-binding protein
MKFAGWGFVLLVAVVMLSLAAAVFAGETLGAVKSRGYLIVGVNGGLYGFGMPDEKGVWRGLDVDTARAIAAAVFGDPDKVKFVALTTQTRFTALQSKEVDVLCRNATKTLTREAESGLSFVAVNYYDGQGFLVPKKLGVKSAKELNGASVCVLPGTTTEQNLADFFRSNKLTMKPVVIELNTVLNQAFFAGRCDCLTSDISQLAGVRAVSPNPDDYVILPELISKEPLAPAVRHGDDQWRGIVEYAVLAMVAAEDLGITSKNIDEMLQSSSPDVKRFLGVTPGNGKALGLDEKWAYNIVKKVGNYGEVFERNIGAESKVGLPRGLNAQWKDGGLMYAPPFK